MIAITNSKARVTDDVRPRSATYNPWASEPNTARNATSTFPTYQPLLGNDASSFANAARRPSYDDQASRPGHAAHPEFDSDYLDQAARQLRALAEFRSQSRSRGWTPGTKNPLVGTTTMAIADNDDPGTLIANELPGHLTPLLIPGVLRIADSKVMPVGFGKSWRFLISWSLGLIMTRILEPFAFMMLYWHIS
jgi:hypothetical protein